MPALNLSKSELEESRQRIPRHHGEAQRSKYAEKWIEAARSEVEELEKRGTWSIVDIPKHKKPLPLKWVFELKTTAEGLIKKYKARVCVRGDLQRPSIGYQGTYTPVVTLTAIRTMLAIAAKNRLPIQIADFVSAGHGQHGADASDLDIEPNFICESLRIPVQYFTSDYCCHEMALGSVGATPRSGDLGFPWVHKILILEDASERKCGQVGDYEARGSQKQGLEDGKDCLS